MFRNLPATLGDASDTLLASGIWTLLGGLLLVPAVMPWRWTGKLAPARPSRTEIGVLIGLFGIAGLWYLLQGAFPVGDAYVTVRDGLSSAFDPILLLQAATATVIGGLAAARWVSPVAAVFSGIPLLAVGLLLVIAPVGAAQWTYPLIWGAQRISFGSVPALSMGVLVGGRAPLGVGRGAVAVASAIDSASRHPGCHGGGLLVLENFAGHP